MLKVPNVDCAVIFDRRLGCADESARDDELADKILFFYPPTVTLTNQVWMDAQYICIYMYVLVLKLYFIYITLILKGCNLCVLDSLLSFLSDYQLATATYILHIHIILLPTFSFSLSLQRSTCSKD
jgi:hypothetical protein